MTAPLGAQLKRSNDIILVLYLFLFTGYIVTWVIIQIYCYIVKVTIRLLLFIFMLAIPSFY